MRALSLFALALLCLLGGTAREAAAQPLAAADDVPVSDAPAATSEGKRDSYDVTATVDSYYSYSPNAPGVNLLAGRALDSVAGAYQVPLVQLYIQKPTTDHRFGFAAKLQAGAPMDNNATTVLHYMGEPDRSTWPLQELYVRYRAGDSKEIGVDVGKFNTCLGYEVTEARDNFNYSRSFLYTYAVPVFHFGLRATYPWSDELTTLVTVGNGWDRIANGGFAGGPHCVGLQTAWSHDQVGAVLNLMTGDEPTGLRSVADSTITWTSEDGDMDAALNGAYGMDANGGAAARWYGAAGYYRYNWAHDSLAARGEMFSDPQGFRTGVANQTLFGLTGTYEHRFGHSLTARAEWRTDFSNQPFFPLNGVASASRTQSTLTCGLITYLK